MITRHQILESDQLSHNNWYLLYMAERHIFPVLEPELHIESDKCECIPIKETDEKTGDINWIHKPLKVDPLTDSLEFF